MLHLILLETIIIIDWERRILRDLWSFCPDFKTTCERRILETQNEVWTLA